MKKILFGVCLILFAGASYATTLPLNQVKQPVQSVNSNTYLKQQVQKKRLDEKAWSKQADDFIGLKRTTKSVEFTASKQLKAIEHGDMLTAQNLQDSLSSI